MRIGILGALEVRAGSSVVPIRQGIPRRLLAVLAVRAPAAVSSDILAELLWHDQQPQNPANALQVQISYLRKALSAAEPGAGALVSTRPGGYALSGELVEVDALRFERLLGDARATAAVGTRDALERAVDLLGDALALWRGTPLADLDDDPFVRGDVTRLGELHLDALETLGELQLALGRHRDHTGELVRLTTEFPLREGFHAQLALAHYRSGRQADALRAYERARSVLAHEVGLDPGPRLRRLAEDILQQSPQLDWVPPPEGTPTDRVTAHELIARPTPCLPRPLTALVGRAAEVEHVAELVRHHRIVTLTGPAGAGKSRLALAVGEHLSDDHELAYVDLGSVAGAEQVATAVAAALGLPSPPDGDVGLAIARMFGRTPTVLVLDTCEHVLAGAAALAGTVTGSTAVVRILATSRRPLAVTGEIAWQVPPLTNPPADAIDTAAIASSSAVALFVERAKAIRPAFSLTEANADDVAAICHALDGLPLAIELAAARTDALSPAAIRARLDNRFDLLVDGNVDATPRQQTLRAAIEWSFDLLDHEQRLLAARLSVFAGSFDLDAVLALAGDLGDPVEAITGLVRHSVVMVMGDDRYRLLDSVRAFAGQELDDGTELRRRHAEHYASLAEQAAPHLRGPDQLAWLERLRRDVPDLRAALGWAFDSGADDVASGLVGALARPWALDGMLDDAMQMFERAARLERIPGELEVAIRSGHAVLAASLGDPTAALELARRAVSRARALGDARSSGTAVDALGVALWALGLLDDAAACHEEAQAHFEEVDDRWGIATSAVHRARTAVDRGEPGARRRTLVALAAARRVGDHQVIGVALEQLARIDLAAGELASADAHARACLAEHRAVGATDGMAAAFHVLGRIRLTHGAAADARELHLLGLSLAHGVRHVAAVCEGLEDLARVAAAEGDAVEALRLLTLAEHARASAGIARRAVGVEGVQHLRAQIEHALGPRAALVETEAAVVPIEAALRQLLT